MADAPRPRTAALEWLDPVYVGGHWVPQMIELAGGLDVLGFPGEQLADGGVVRGGGGGAGGGALDAVRPVRRGGGRRDHAPARPARAARRARGGRGRRGLLLAARPARSWTAWSCSGTCCTRTSCRRPIRAARSSSTWRAAASSPPARMPSSAALEADRPRSRRPRPRRPCPRTRARARASGSRTRSPSSNRTSAARPPPTKPPMCPPIEMLGTLNVITRFSTIQMPSPLSMTLMPRLRMTTAVAAMSPKMAPEAPTVGDGGLEQQRAERAGEQRHEVDEPEAQPPDRRLEQRRRGCRARAC